MLSRLPEVRASPAWKNCVICNCEDGGRSQSVYDRPTESVCRRRSFPQSMNFMRVQRLVAKLVPILIEQLEARHEQQRLRSPLRHGCLEHIELHLMHHDVRERSRLIDIAGQLKPDARDAVKLVPEHFAQLDVPLEEQRCRIQGCTPSIVLPVTDTGQIRRARQVSAPAGHVLAFSFPNASMPL